MNILVIEDNIADFELIDIYTKNIREFNLSNATTLKEAIHSLTNNSYDFILLDLGLPDSDGKNTFDELSKHIQDIPVILLTGTEDNEMAMTLLEKGAQDYLLKNQITPLLLKKSINYSFKRFQLQKELTISQKKLKELNKTKDKFFSIIAHDLRNPIGSFVITTDYLMTCIEDGSTEDFNLLINEINKSSKHLQVLLENLLEWANAQSGNISFEPTLIDISIVLNTLISLIEINATETDITIKSNISSNFMLKADPNMMNTILRNLITNALKFSYPKGNIVIDLKEENDYYLFSVKDDGIGISKEDIKLLFRIGINTTSIGSSENKGTGLGLLLVKEFVEIHNGKVWVESEEEKGSIFYFTISKNL